jgi:RNA polymerase sigma factor (sigma-70 family)
VNHADFEKIFDAHAGMLFTHAYFRVSNREKAKDLVQDTFIKAWESVTRSEGGVDAAPVLNWKALLYAILNNLIIDHYRRKKPVSLDEIEESREEQGGLSLESLATGGLAEESERFDQSVTSTEVREAICLLSLRDQELVTLRFLNEEPAEVVAGMLSLTENALYVRSHRALKRLKEILLKRNYISYEN